MSDRCVQECRQQLDDVAPLLQTAREKAKVLTMMEPYGSQGRDEVQFKVDELAEMWEALQTKLQYKIAETEQCQAVNALNDEMETVARRLDELAASTEDLTASSYDCTRVLEQRDNYEVRAGMFSLNPL